MRALLFCAALTLAACDSAEPAPVTPGGTPPVTPTGTPEPGAQSFRFSGFPTSITVDVPDTRVIALAPYTGRALPQGFRATAQGSSAGESASVLATSSLSVRALREGASVVNVRVAAPGYRDTTLTFTVVSRVQCPPAAPAGSVDFLPVATEKTDRYNYATSLNFFSLFESVETRGLLTSEVHAPTCYRGVRTFDVTYTFSGTSTRQTTSSPPGGTTTPLETTARLSMTEDSTNVVTYAVPGISRGLNVITASLQRYGTAGEFERVATARPSDTCRSALRFRAGVGLVGEEMAGCYYAYRVSASRSIAFASGL